MLLQPTKMAAVLRKRFASSFANSRFPLSPPKQQPTLKQATLYSKRALSFSVFHLHLAVSAIVECIACCIDIVSDCSM